MRGQTSEDLLTLYDTAALNARYWWTFILMSAVFVFDFFDFLVVGYLLAAVAPEWHLTYGQSAVILYSGGVGAILGALVFGAFSDAWGRKPQMVIGTFICAVSSGRVRCFASSAETTSFLRGGWLDRLVEGGRLILPLTAGEFPGGDIRQGAVFRIERRDHKFLARRISGVVIFPCEGIRDAESEAALATAFEKGRVHEVTRLYRRDDVPAEDCWLRGTGWGTDDGAGQAELIARWSGREQTGRRPKWGDDRDRHIKTNEMRRLIAPSSMPEIAPTSINSSSQKGMRTHPSKREPQPPRYTICRIR